MFNALAWLLGYNPEMGTLVCKNESKEKIKDSVSFYLKLDKGLKYEVLDKKTNVKIGELLWIWVKEWGVGWEFKIDKNVTKYSIKRPPIITEDKCLIYKYIDVLMREAGMDLLYRKKLACNLYVKGV